VRKFRDRVRARFDVSIAEVDRQDTYQVAVFGVSVVSSSGSVCDQVLAQVGDLAALQEDAVLVARATELIPLSSAHFDDTRRFVSGAGVP
jgi:uncharacterized protein YlxP (DUF503 family)